MKAKLFIILTLFISLSLFSQETEESVDSTETVLSEKVDETTLKINRDTETNDSPALSGSTLALTDYLFVIFVLIVVIAALYFVLRFIKKVGGNRIGLDNDQIKVLSTKALKGTTALHLVEVGSQIFLIGATDSSVNSISEITDKETKDTIVLNSTGDDGVQNSFVQLFTDKLKKFNRHSDETVNSSTEINTQKEKLDRF